MVLEIGVPKTWVCHGNTNDSIIPSLNNQAGSSLINFWSLHVFQKDLVE